MKVKINQLPKKFVPIKLTITIETEKELCDLWLRQNMCGEEVDKANGCYLKYNATQAENSFCGDSLWDVVEKLVGEYELREGD